MLVESHTGRPTKIEGNPEHPGSLGSSDIFNQAAILTFWDPDRSQSVIYDGRVSTWSDFAAAMSNERTRLSPRGAGLRILTKTFSSPTLGAQMKSLLAQFPDAKWHQYEVCGGDSVREGARLAFGKPVNTVYRFDQADVIVSLDADFLTCGAGHVRYAREFASRRDLSAGPDSKLNRLYVAESMPTSTGSVSDHRLAVRSADIDDLARQLAAGVGVAVPPSANSNAKNSAWVGAVGRDLAAHRGSSIVIAGEHQPPFVHALAHAMNAALGNVGKTVVYTDSVEPNPVNQLESLSDLVSDLNAGKVDFLLILGGNPVDRKSVV
jgi:molybdopterin-containing oxidoreductase family iron-sulfur binding subunit